MCALVTGVQTCALPISWRRRQRRHRRWRVPRTVSETHAMSRILALLYGAACYAVFLATFLYAIAFVTGVGVPKHVDSGPPTALPLALAIDLALLALFAIQHSGMARPAFKRWWTRIVPAAVERSTY